MRRRARTEPAAVHPVRSRSRPGGRSSARRSWCVTCFSPPRPRSRTRSPEHPDSPRNSQHVDLAIPGDDRSAISMSTSLFKYPCSYLIYSEAFDALPEPARDHVYRRLLEVLSGDGSRIAALRPGPSGHPRDPAGDQARSARRMEGRPLARRGAWCAAARSRMLRLRGRLADLITRPARPSVNGSAHGERGNCIPPCRRGRRTIAAARAAL